MAFQMLETLEHFPSTLLYWFMLSFLPHHGDKVENGFMLVTCSTVRAPQRSHRPGSAQAGLNLGRLPLTSRYGMILLQGCTSSTSLFCGRLLGGSFSSTPLASSEVWDLPQLPAKKSVSFSMETAPQQQSAHHTCCWSSGPFRFGDVLWDKETQAADTMQVVLLLST